MKNSFYLLLLLSAFSLCSCSKGGDTPPATTTATFNIKGLKDVDMASVPGTTYTYDIQVESITGAHDTVSLYANEVPAGIYVNFVPFIGVTPFTATVTVKCFISDGSTQTVKVNGVSASGVKTYSMKIIIPSLRGWKLGDDSYWRTTVSKNPSDNPPSIWVGGDKGSELYLVFAPGATLPSTSSSYSIVANAAGPNEMSIIMNKGAEKWTSTGGGTNTGTFNFVDGRLAFRCSNVVMSNGVSTKTLECTVAE